MLQLLLEVVICDMQCNGMVARPFKATPESWKYSAGSQEDAAEAWIRRRIAAATEAA